MPATVKIYYDLGGSNGSPGTTHNVTDNGTNKLRFKTADVNGELVDTNNPVPIPQGLGALSRHGFWKHIYLTVTGGTFTQIDNVRCYSDGANSLGTGVSFFVGDGTQTKTNSVSHGYAVAVGTSGVTGSELTVHGSVSAKTNAFSYTSGSPRTVGISESGGIIDSTGETTNYLVLQMTVASNASSGTTATETLTFSYDEI
jgi:hypothetical protein